jgi:thioesterase DpgC
MMAMNLLKPDTPAAEKLAAAGLLDKDVAAWLRAQPVKTGRYAADRKAYGAFWKKSSDLIGKLHPAARRDREVAGVVMDVARQSRERFLRAHADAIYDALTGKRSRFVRLEELVAAAAKLLPGLVPSADQIAAENGLRQGQKAGLEIDQGLFVSAVLRSPQSGRHLCHALLLPRPESRERLPRFIKEGRARFPGASIERRGKAAILTYDNPRFLNAEDHGTLAGFEVCVDLALLDPQVEIAVLRGGVVEHPKYKDRRVFGSGINLTHLYHGRIPFLWYLVRDLGYVNKLYRGLAMEDGPPPDEFGGQTIEKPFIAAVESFAIGGHCQVLLAVDYVLAEKTAFMTLPARKEGIIPGAANMRLPRAVGDRLARQAIQYERRLECDSLEGRLICDEIVEPGTMDAAIERVVSGLTSSGVVSAASNRRAFRITQEPLDMFRDYFAVYAREQAYCHFSPALISNLEKYWDAASRKP